MKKVQKTAYCYTIIFALLLAQTLFTAYAQGMFLKTKETTHKLTQHKQELLKEQLGLKNKLSQVTSLKLMAENSSFAEYEAITSPLAISRSTTVALR
jgi:hypothetical protein